MNNNWNSEFKIGDKVVDNDGNVFVIKRVCFSNDNIEYIMDNGEIYINGLEDIRFEKDLKLYKGEL